MTRPSHQRLMADEALMAAALDALEIAGCRFWACDGPTLRPKPMVTCCVCAEVARLRRRLGRPIRQDVEGCFRITEATRQADLQRATRSGFYGDW